MRRAALTAAALVVRAPDDAPLSPRTGWRGDEAWGELATIAASQDLASLDDWLLAAAAAAELHAEAAAAFSILAEDEQISLVTPASFARIAVAGLGANYDAALACALGANRFAAASLIETLEPPGRIRPLSQRPLRLAEKATAMIFDGAEPTLAIDREACAPCIVHGDAARAAALILEADGAVWLRGQSKRHTRQLAMDLAALSGRGTVYVSPLEGRAPAISGFTDDLPVIDLFDLNVAPPMPPRADTLYVVIAPSRMEHPGFRAVDAPLLTQSAAEALWAVAPVDEDGKTWLSERYSLTLSELRAAIREARTLAVMSRDGGFADDEIPADRLDAAVRAAGARRMGPSVSLVECDVDLDDLVARPSVRRQLDDIINWHRSRKFVWRDMELLKDRAEARGLTIMFSGPPGGGKTFAARGLAQSLGLNLYRIDISQVVSKYIGETEKALARVFDEAEAGHGVLFFDEADAIFGKRSEVKDAHDRYANIEVGYLLQRMESFDGVMLLATNLRSNLDPAFLRRIRFLIEFSAPARTERRILWDRNLPAAPWRDPNLDIDLLAERFRLTGGNIRNVAVAAAHIAATERAPVAAPHVAAALYRELEKAGLPRTKADFGAFAEHVEALAS